MKRSIIILLVLGLSFCAGANGQSGVITTIAGNGNNGFAGDGGPATSATLYSPFGIARDLSGNLFIADTGNFRVRKVSAAGTITTVAGNGMGTYAGDGGPAASASLGGPTGLAVDASGNLFIADTYNYRVRKVSASGIITTIAGTGSAGFSGDGGPATAASINGVSYLAVDGSGNLFIADSNNNRIRKVSASGIITTIAGTGTAGFAGDGGPATSALLNGPDGIAVDSSGNLFIADYNNYRIRKVSPTGIVTTVTGGPTPNSSGAPVIVSVAVDAAGNLFYVDSEGSVQGGSYVAGSTVVKVAADTSALTRIAGYNFDGFAGDGGPATSAVFNAASDIVVDPSGFLLIADRFNGRIRKVSSSLLATPASLNFLLVAGASASQQVGLSGIVAGLAWNASSSASWISLAPTSEAAPDTLTVTGNATSISPGTYTGTVTISTPSGSPPQETINVGMTVGAASNVISISPPTMNFVIPQASPAQSQTLQIGGTAGAPWQATATTATGGAWLSLPVTSGKIPTSLSVMAAASNLTPGTYQGSITIQAAATPSSITTGVTMTVIQGGGIIMTLAGKGGAGFSGDGGPATSALLSYPQNVAVDASGNVYIADQNNNRIRKVSPGGIIATVAGSGPTGYGNGSYSGDGGPATSASLSSPADVTVDASGNIFISDHFQAVVRKVSATSGIITTVAGNGTAGLSGDGGPATSAQLYYPAGIAVDAAGNLFIADLDNNRIRKVSVDGVITTIAGTAPGGFGGDGGPATAALFHTPSAVAVDAIGNLFIGDQNNHRVREVSTNGIITTIAGNGTMGFSGDGGPAMAAELGYPIGLAVDPSGNLFIADSAYNRVRKVSPDGMIATAAGNGVNGFTGDGGLATSAELSSPTGVALDSAGNLYIADEGNGRVREVTAPPAPAPSITPGRIVPIYSNANTIQPGEWVSLFGTNLASSTAIWNGSFTTSLGGTSVTIDGKAAYPIYVSPTQINLQAPGDTATGSVPVVVTTGGGTATSTVTLAQFAPSFCLLDAVHVTGIILRADGSGTQGGGTYDILGPTGNSLGYPTVAARAGDTVVLFAVGLGTTNPAPPAGQPFSGAAPTTNSVSLSINKTNVIPTFAGLSSAGLYQINLVAPAGLGTGDVPLVATVGGAQTPTGVVISLQ